MERARARHEWLDTEARLHDANALLEQALASVLAWEGPLALPLEGQAPVRGARLLLRRVARCRTLAHLRRELGIALDARLAAAEPVPPAVEADLQRWQEEAAARVEALTAAAARLASAEPGLRVLHLEAADMTESERERRARTALLSPALDEGVRVVGRLAALRRAAAAHALAAALRRRGSSLDDAQGRIAVADLRGLARQHEQLDRQGTRRRASWREATRVTLMASRERGWRQASRLLDAGGRATRRKKTRAALRRLSQDGGGSGLPAATDIGLVLALLAGAPITEAERT